MARVRSPPYLCVHMGAGEVWALEGRPAGGTHGAVAVHKCSGGRGRSDECCAAVGAGRAQELICGVLWPAPQAAKPKCVQCGACIHPPPLLLNLLMSAPKHTGMHGLIHPCAFACTRKPHT